MPSDPLEAQSLKIAQDTYNATINALRVAGVALVVGFFALFIALRDAINNSRLLRIALARAKFAIDSVPMVVDLTNTPGAGVDFKVLAVNFNARNIGEKAARRYMLTIYVPSSVCYDTTPYVGERATIDGVEYRITRFREYSGIILFPFGTGIGWPYSLYVNMDVTEVEFLWKVYDEDGPSPEKSYGKVTISVNK